MISVIIPIYNKGEYLEKCISSVINQTYKNIEVILVNDGSTDNSLEICRKYEKIDSRIVVIDKKNEGVSEARNDGLKISTGEKIVFIDADDWVDSNYLLSLNKYDDDIVICGYKSVINDHIIDNNNFDLEMNSFEEIKNNILDKKYINLIVTPYLKLFKKSIISNNNLLFDKSLSFGEDACFVLNYLFHCNSLRFIPNNNYYNVELNGTLSRKYINDLYNKGYELIKVVHKFKNELNDEMIKYWEFRNIKLFLYNEKNQKYLIFKKDIKNLKIKRIDKCIYFSIYDNIVRILMNCKLYTFLFILYKVR